MGQVKFMIILYKRTESQEYVCWQRYLYYLCRSLQQFCKRLTQISWSIVPMRQPTLHARAISFSKRGIIAGGMLSLPCEAAFIRAVATISLLMKLTSAPASINLAARATSLRSTARSSWLLSSNDPAGQCRYLQKCVPAILRSRLNPVYRLILRLQ